VDQKSSIKDVLRQEWVLF